MTELLEEKGLKVLTVPLPARVSGFTCLVKRPGDVPDLPVIVVNNQFSLERRRLTLAHELAHRRDRYPQPVGQRGGKGRDTRSPALF